MSCECDGSGKVVDRIPPTPFRPIGNGLEIGGGGGFSSRLCDCRKNLPPRAGEAWWWSSRDETIAELQFVMFDEQAVVSLAVEVPISKDNYVVHRRGDNVYYPVSVQLHVSSDELNWLFPAEARALAAALIKAADRADELDGPLAEERG